MTDVKISQEEIKRQMKICMIFQFLKEMHKSNVNMSDFIISA